MNKKTVSQLHTISSFYEDPVAAFQDLRTAIEKGNPLITDSPGGNLKKSFSKAEIEDFKKRGERPARNEILQIRLDSTPINGHKSSFGCSECCERNGVVTCRNTDCTHHNEITNGDIVDGFDRRYQGEVEEPQCVEAPSLLVRSEKH